MTASSVVFLFVLLLAAGFFAYNAQRLVTYMRTVGGPDHHHRHPPR